jgi:lysophospholipase L1-like esterase
MRNIFILILFTVVSVSSIAQVDTAQWAPPAPPHHAFIKDAENTFTQQQRLDTFFKKLVKLRATHKGKVSIVHIGDSHMQADMMTCIVRNGFQDFFGDAGRGLVFPYQLAGTNAPKDIHSSTNATWTNAKIISRDLTKKTGICGIGLQTETKKAWVRINMRDAEFNPCLFNRLVFFLGDDEATYHINDTQLMEPAELHTRRGIDTPSVVYNAPTLLDGFELTKVESATNAGFGFYGVSLERNDTCGVLYHTIGVNGARFDQYNNSDLFWRQLRALRGDLYIISLGTNEAQTLHVNEAAFIEICNTFIQNIKRIAPRATILITTPPGSYFRGKKPNAAVEAVSHALTQVCATGQMPYWHLNTISGSKTSALGWNKANMLARDLVHFNQAGYQLQGQLFLSAFAKGYNSYAKHHPYVAPKPSPAKLPVVAMKTTVVPDKTVVAPPVIAPTVPLTPPAKDTAAVPAAKKKSNIKIEYLE